MPDGAAELEVEVDRGGIVQLRRHVGVDRDQALARERGAAVERPRGLAKRVVVVEVSPLAFVQLLTLVVVLAP